MFSSAFPRSPPVVTQTLTPIFCTRPTSSGSACTHLAQRRITSPGAGVLVDQIDPFGEGHAGQSRIQRLEGCQLRHRAGTDDHVPGKIMAQKGGVDVFRVYASSVFKIQKQVQMIRAGVRESLVHGRNSFAVSGIERPYFFQGESSDRAFAVGGSVHCLVVDDHDFAVGRRAQIELDGVRADPARPGKRGDCVLGALEHAATM